MTSPSEEEAQATGTKVLGGLRFPGGVGLIAPGHNSIFRVGDDMFMVHHVRLADAPAQHEAQVRRVHWTASGWPVVSPHPYAGEDTERLPVAEPIAGEWDAVRFAPEVSALVDARRVEITADGMSDGTPVAMRLAVSWVAEWGAGSEASLDAVVFGAWDPVAGRTVLAFSGIDADGVVWSGSKTVTA
jgi:arabinan endo-1,5-alpha-L-arabinosidase